jgi:hypothetical protein
MKNKIVLAILILLISGLIFCYSSFYNSQIPKGFAPIDTLYHGSPNPNIKVFEPRNKGTRNKDEGQVVFATPSLKIAGCYLFKWDDSWVHQSVSWKNGDKANYQVTMVISDKARFEKADHGGTIYILPASGFHF